MGAKPVRFKASAFTLARCEQALRNDPAQCAALYGQIMRLLAGKGIRKRTQRRTN